MVNRKCKRLWTYSGKMTLLKYFIIWEHNHIGHLYYNFPPRTWCVILTFHVPDGIALGLRATQRRDTVTTFTQILQLKLQRFHKDLVFRALFLFLSHLIQHQIVLLSEKMGKGEGSANLSTRHIPGILWFLFNHAAEEQAIPPSSQQCSELLTCQGDKLTSAWTVISHVSVLSHDSLFPGSSWASILRADSI